ncbi:MAG: hypothetical protein AAFQ17_06605 [Pseudomonadota bacterium]
MPANRSRTERWRDTLQQIYERGGGLEVAVDRRSRDAGPLREEVIEPPKDLLWRVKLLGLTDDKMRIESPGAMGAKVNLEVGTRLIGVMAVGQNRWMFHTTVQVLEPPQDPRRPGTVVISMPDRVERCTRRWQQRISTAELNLPSARCWPLIDPSSVVTAEVESRTRLHELRDSGKVDDRSVEEALDQLPSSGLEVGVGFRAVVQNIGGGGLGLKVPREDRSAVESSKLYWTRLDLRPVIPAPLDMTCRLAHTHSDHEQNIYCGMAFEFDLNPSHKMFVIEEIDRYMRHLIELQHE